jgi:hypothetical protein
MSTLVLRLWKKVLTLLLLAQGTALWAQGNSGTPPGQANRSVGILIFDLHPNRISPDTITVDQGFYLIRVRNGMTSANLAVVLDHENVPRIIESQLTSRASGTQKPAQLNPGKHTLRVGTNPRWTATVIVRPR